MIWGTPRRDSIRKLIGLAWRVGIRTFGHERMDSRRECALRLLEEALELAQAEGVPQGQAAKLVCYTYGRRPGLSEQEAAGVGNCLLAWAAAADADLGALIEAELERVMTLDKIKVAEKLAVKDRWRITAKTSDSY